MRKNEQLFGGNSGPLFLPDIGTFFDKDLDRAFAIVDRLAASGISLIKGEVLSDPNLCLNDGSLEKYWNSSSRRFDTENYHSLISRKALSFAEYRTLFNYVRAVKAEIVLSVYDFAGADFALSEGALALKIASSNITNAPLIKYLGGLGCPLILDTGHSSLEEIARAVNWVQDEGCQDFVVQHSPPGPPRPVSEHNLNFMVNLGRTLGVPYGLSDHHFGDEMLYAAVALGANVVEKGVVLENQSADQDVSHALLVSSVNDVVSKMQNIAEALGTGSRYLRRDRQKYISRMGLIASVPLKPGDKISLSNVRFAFPQIGIGTEFWELVEGSTVLRAFDPLEPIEWIDIEKICGEKASP